MYTIEELLNMNVETLRHFCTQKNDFIGTALKDERIKKKLLNPENKSIELTINNYSIYF